MGLPSTKGREGGPLPVPVPAAGDEEAAEAEDDSPVPLFLLAAVQADAAPVSTLWRNFGAAVSVAAEAVAFAEDNAEARAALEDKSAGDGWT